MFEYAEPKQKRKKISNDTLQRHTPQISFDNVRVRPTIPIGGLPVNESPVLESGTNREIIQRVPYERNAGGLETQNYQLIRTGGFGVQDNRYVDGQNTHNFQLGWHSGVEFTRNPDTGKFQILNIKDFGVGGAAHAAPIPVPVPAGDSFADSVVTRGVDTCTVILLVDTDHSRHAMLHLDGANLAQGLQEIQRINEQWLLPPEYGGIDNITVSYADDQADGGERTQFVDDLQHFVTTLLQGGQRIGIDIINRGTAQHSEIGLGHNPQNELELFGDLIHPDLGKLGALFMSGEITEDVYSHFSAQTINQLTQQQRAAFNIPNQQQANPDPYAQIRNILWPQQPQPPQHPALQHPLPPPPPTQPQGFLSRLRRHLPF